MTDAATALRRWLLIVGGFYLFLGIRLLPIVNGPMIEAIGVDAIYHGGDLEPGTAAYAFVLDWMGTFGLSLIPLGAVLLVAARDPLRHRLLVHLVIWHEIGAGVVADLGLILGGNVTTAFYLGFIGVHLGVAGTGVWLLHRTRTAASATTGDVGSRSRREARPERR